MLSYIHNATKGCKGKYWCYFDNILLECSCGWRNPDKHEHTADVDAGEAE